MSKTLFDLDALRQETGPKLFARGEAYAQGGYVELIDVDKDSVLAHVEGSEIYIVELTPSISAGLCTCPAFEDWGVCKHVVATALVYNDLSPTEVRAAHGRMARLRDGLALESQEALIERLMDLARRSPEVLEALEGDRDA